MTVDRIQGLACRWFVADTALNWIIAAAMLVSPDAIEALIANAQLLTPGIYRILGAGFLIFAAWQTVTIRRGTIATRSTMRIAAAMALLPAVLLAAGLCGLTLPLRSWARHVLWVAVAYMLLLGSLYAVVYLRLASKEA
jgi:hypothetical protein